MNFVRFEVQIHPHEPRYFVYDFRGSMTPLYVFEDMKRSPTPDLSGSKLALDIGANVGMWSIRMAKLYPDCKFIAFEPYKINAQHLRMGVQINETHNVEIVECAVTHDGSDITLVMDPTNSGSASIYNTLQSELYPQQRATSMSLNDVCRSHECIDVLKVDIEGAEFMLFEGFHQWDKIKKVFIEVHPIYAGITDAEKEYTIKRLLALLRGKLGSQNVFVDCTDEKFRNCLGEN